MIRPIFVKFGTVTYTDPLNNPAGLNERLRAEQSRVACAPKEPGECDITIRTCAVVRGGLSKNT